jgi:flagellar hook-length control protein FliK
MIERDALLDVTNEEGKVTFELTTVANSFAKALDQALADLIEPLKDKGIPLYFASLK